MKWKVYHKRGKQRFPLHWILTDGVHWEWDHSLLSCPLGQSCGTTPSSYCLNAYSWTCQCVLVGRVLGFTQSFSFMPDVLMARLDPLVCLAQMLTYRESGGLESVLWKVQVHKRWLYVTTWQKVTLTQLITCQKSYIADICFTYLILRQFLKI